MNAQDSAQTGKAHDCLRVVVMVTGGIAAYKTATIVSQLVQDGAQVTVAMTESATRFVTPLTFQALSGRPVYTSVWEHIESQDPQHIATAKAADAVVIAPESRQDGLTMLSHSFSQRSISLERLCCLPPR